ncbi:MAG: ArsI/CadI family heavy metal resistance metalloenzyme [Planctomycetota bacterium]|nr:ArsI/CadI family heavy metal resistance metalloenzyme [Planctomycetota bacterium]
MNRNAFHVSLEVADLSASLAFYRTLFAVPPAKERADYAKFELERPALVLSLLPGDPPQGRSRVGHLGLRVEDDAELAALAGRLRAAGHTLREESEVTCCYARANKYWASDPDGNAWELYRFLEDREARDEPAAAPADGGCCSPGSCA